MEYMVKKIEGRFKHLKESILKQMQMELKFLLKSWGAVGPEELGIPAEQGGLPLWAEVEFLDNIVQFEMECNPFLHAELN